MTYFVITPDTVQDAIAWSRQDRVSRAHRYCREAGYAKYVAVFNAEAGIGFFVTDPGGIRSSFTELSYKDLSTAYLDDGVWSKR